MSQCTIVTVTATVAEGTVVRWYWDYTVLDDIDEYDPVVSASRDGVLVGAHLHRVPTGILVMAQQTYETLQRDPRADVGYLATHRRSGPFGPYVGIEA
ncbi:MAG TPA: hypothetical protein VJ777_17875 [Mycobacterium sp.]|nr:hypothetical protein [Mycobacterium sp.]